jgi:predicted short-subunit dehydrogenase-like oxidoreductase (DUF2520 family)
MERRRFLIFGPGRVGRSIKAYVRHLGHEATLLSRAEAEAEKARTLIKEADVVAAAIPDSALPAFSTQWAPALDGKMAIHFSGALTIDGIWSYHPLYAFPPSALPPEAMRAVAFAREEKAPPLAEIIPGAPNPEFVVKAEDRAYYHALAVLSGNFASFLWNKAAMGFSSRLKIDPETIVASYLSGLVDRFREHPFDSMTGPVKRRDRATVEANLAALENEPELVSLYATFLALAWPDFLKK